MNDVVRISRGTTKQDELFDYVDAPDYLKSKIKDYDGYEKDKDNYEMCAKRIDEADCYETTYDKNITDKTYACIDTENQQGYLTYRAR